MKLSDIAVVTTGPGSQPDENDGSKLEYLKMPDGMHTYTTPVLPEPEELVGLEQVREVLATVQRELESFRVENRPREIDVTGLDADNREILDQVFGEGEVSIIFNGVQIARIQESVLAGVWRIHSLDNKGGVDRDTIEIGAVPALVIDKTFNHAAIQCHIDVNKVPDGACNSPSILAEIQEYVMAPGPGREAHVINLTLLPMSAQDLKYLQQQLGTGGVTILSRGYGNCRITSTAIRNVWWVQYFNSMDVMILNTIEIADVPVVACASQEDIEDSSERLREIMETYFGPA